MQNKEKLAAVGTDRVGEVSSHAAVDRESRNNNDNNNNNNDNDNNKY